MKLSANLSILFPDLPLLERPAAAAAAGFRAVELWWPFAVPEPPEPDLAALVGAIEDADVVVASLNFDAGDLPGGDRGLVSIPARADRFRANVDVTVDLARRLGCRTLNALYGNREAGVDPAEQDELALEHLVLAADAAARVGATVVVEPLNAFESPRYPLTSTRGALDVIERANAAASGEVKLLYDAYHMQRMEGNLIATIRAHAERFGHVQIADAPDRTQPGTGEVAYERVLDALRRTGYDRFVGLEYKPTPGLDPFAWLPRSERGAGVEPPG